MSPSVEARDDRHDDERRRLPVDADDLGGLLAGVLAAEGIPDRAEASLVLVDAGVIADLKRDHLDGDGAPTDVLAFPLDGTGPVPDGEPWLVGDVVVCPEVAAGQAVDHAGDLSSELALLVAHGGLHLCGWDHAGVDDRDAMWSRERELLAALDRAPTGDPWQDPAGTGRAAPTAPGGGA